MRTTKREPLSFAATSKSMLPVASPSSKCSFGLKVKVGFGGRDFCGGFGGAVAAEVFAVGALVFAARDVVGGEVRDVGEGVVRAPSRLRAASASSAGMRVLEARRPRPSARRRGPRPSGPWPGRSPSIWRCASACSSSSATMAARRRSSSAIRSAAEDGTFRRSLSAASNASGLALIHLMSNMTRLA